MAFRADLSSTHPTTIANGLSHGRSRGRGEQALDTAAPGSPREDVGYMAWAWCLASKDTAPAVPKQAAQVRVLADAYGLGARGRSVLVDAILEQLSRNARFWAEHVPGHHGIQPGEDVIAARIELAS